MTGLQAAVSLSVLEKSMESSVQQVLADSVPLAAKKPLLIPQEEAPHQRTLSAPVRTWNQPAAAKNSGIISDESPKPGISSSTETVEGTVKLFSALRESKTSPDNEIRFHLSQTNTCNDVPLAETWAGSTAQRCQDYTLRNEIRSGTTPHELHLQRMLSGKQTIPSSHAQAVISLEQSSVRSGLSGGSVLASTFAPLPDGMISQVPKEDVQSKVAQNGQSSVTVITLEHTALGESERINQLRSHTEHNSLINWGQLYDSGDSAFTLLEGHDADLQNLGLTVQGKMPEFHLSPFHLDAVRDSTLQTCSRPQSSISNAGHREMCENDKRRDACREGTFSGSDSSPSRSNWLPTSRHQGQQWTYLQDTESKKQQGNLQFNHHYDMQYDEQQIPYFWNAEMHQHREPLSYQYNQYGQIQIPQNGQPQSSQYKSLPHNCDQQTHQYVLPQTYQYVPTQSSQSAPPQSSQCAPPQSPQYAPHQSLQYTPPQSSECVPPRSSQYAPPQSSQYAPLQSLQYAPPQSSECVPPRSSQYAQRQPAQTPSQFAQFQTVHSGQPLTFVKGQCPTVCCTQSHNNDQMQTYLDPQNHPGQEQTIKNKAKHVPFSNLAAQYQNCTDMQAAQGVMTNHDVLSQQQIGFINDSDSGSYASLSKGCFPHSVLGEHRPQQVFTKQFDYLKRQTTVTQFAACVNSDCESIVTDTCDQLKSNKQEMPALKIPNFTYQQGCETVVSLPRVVPNMKTSELVQSFGFSPNTINTMPMQIVMIIYESNTKESKEESLTLLQESSMPAEQSTDTLNIGSDLFNPETRVNLVTPTGLKVACHSRRQGQRCTNSFPLNTSEHSSCTEEYKTNLGESATNSFPNLFPSEKNDGICSFSTKTPSQIVRCSPNDDQLKEQIVGEQLNQWKLHSNRKRILKAQQTQVVNSEKLLRTLLPVLNPNESKDKKYGDKITVPISSKVKGLNGTRLLLPEEKTGQSKEKTEAQGVVCVYPI